MSHLIPCSSEVPTWRKCRSLRWAPLVLLMTMLAALLGISTPALAAGPTVQSKASSAAANAPALHKNGGKKSVAADGSPMAPCDELVDMSDADVPTRTLLDRARLEGLQKSDPVCLAMTALRELNLGECERASHAAKRAKELAPGEPLAALATGMVKACELTKEAVAIGGGVPVECDPVKLQEVVFEVGRGVFFVPQALVADLVVRTLEADLVLRCRDDGQLKALFAAIEMAEPGLRSPALHRLDKHPNAPWNLTGAALLGRLERAITTGDPGPGGQNVIRAIARAMLDAWPEKDEVKAQNLNAQVVARALLRADGALAAAPEGFGVFLQDLSALEQQGMLDALPVLDAAAAIPPWAVDAALGVQVSAQLQSLTARLSPLERRPEGALLLLKMRGMGALESDKTPCEVSTLLGDGLVSFASRGASNLPFGAYKGLVTEIARRALEAAKQCPSGMSQVAELTKVIERLKKDESPWSPVQYIEGDDQ